jgi:hypothetical protein
MVRTMHLIGAADVRTLDRSLLDLPDTARAPRDPGDGG